MQTNVLQSTELCVVCGQETPAGRPSIRATQGRWCCSQACADADELEAQLVLDVMGDLFE